MALMREFYATDAVLHPVPEAHFAKTCDLAFRQSPFARMLVDQRDGAYTGYASLSFTHSNEAGGLVVLIEEIYVRDAYKGRGIGTELLAYVRSQYDGKAKRYRLEVCGGNAGAIRLYTRLGFRPLPYGQMVLEP